MSKQKYYVVWKGRQTGIFESWLDCQNQIHGFAGAEYKSFKTRQLAQKAFNNSSEEFIGKNIFETVLSEDQIKLIGEPVMDSIAVDGAWDISTGW